MTPDEFLNGEPTVTGTHACPGLPPCPDFMDEASKTTTAMAAERDTLKASPACARAAKSKRPLIVCLCGSTRFTDLMLIKQWELTKQGKIVLSWCALPESYLKGSHIGDVEGVKDIVDELHKRKIDLADEVMILNVGGYVGNSTRSELAYAMDAGKRVLWLEPENAQEALAALNAMKTGGDEREVEDG